MVESMLEFEVVESLLALSRNLLAVVERLLAPSFCCENLRVAAGTDRQRKSPVHKG